MSIEQDSTDWPAGRTSVAIRRWSGAQPTATALYFLLKLHMAIKQNCLSCFRDPGWRDWVFDRWSFGVLDLKWSGLIRTLILGRFWLKQYRPNAKRKYWLPYCVALRFQEGAGGSEFDVWFLSWVPDSVTYALFGLNILFYLVFYCCKRIKWPITCTELWFKIYLEMSSHLFSAVHRFMIAHLLSAEAIKIMLSQSVKNNPARQMFFSLNRRKANLLRKTSNYHTRLPLWLYGHSRGWFPADIQKLEKLSLSQMSAAELYQWFPTSHLDLGIPIYVSHSC